MSAQTKKSRLRREASVEISLPHASDGSIRGRGETDTNTAAWKTWAVELSCAGAAFLAVSAILTFSSVLGPLLVPILTLLIFVELWFVWRAVWASLALLAVLGDGSSALQRSIRSLVGAWGTQSARRVLLGAATTTLLTGVVSGTAVAASSNQDAISDSLWEADADISVEEGAADFQADPGNVLDVVLGDSFPTVAPRPSPVDDAVAGESHASSPKNTPLGSAQEDIKNERQCVSKAGRPGPRMEAPRTEESAPIMPTALPNNDIRGSSPVKSSLSSPVQNSKGSRANVASAAETSHIVRSGESLWIIAQQRLPQGASAAAIDHAWKQIYALNNDVVGTNPDLIEPGMVLMVDGVDFSGER